MNKAWAEWSQRAFENNEHPPKKLMTIGLTAFPATIEITEIMDTTIMNLYWLSIKLTINGAVVYSVNVRRNTPDGLNDPALLNDAFEIYNHLLAWAQGNVS